MAIHLPHGLPGFRDLASFGTSETPTLGEIVVGLMQSTK